uniref:(northern house mosquito) hypothetical protein n=1 Tax=Culex pipiens TaxID=7175 RepID=A0A8D8ET12_CULPI
MFHCLPVKDPNVLCIFGCLQLFFLLTFFEWLDFLPLRFGLICLCFSKKKCYTFKRMYSSIYYFWLVGFVLVTFYLQSALNKRVKVELRGEGSFSFFLRGTQRGELTRGPVLPDLAKVSTFR